ncbi:MAG: hypothetical protein CMM99_04750 [Rickettsiales bacterium]|nr:hypothetical protein [Rickettsiales bacterium]|tara:strand:+ start:301 stop:786 length:486 start_codon:yes stop_codon:yes gene_type:complete
MSHLKIAIGVLIALSASRFIPHPPNFTSLLALSFYIPAIFGIRYIAIVLIALLFTDLVIGFHSTMLFTSGSIVLIGLISGYFNKSIIYRILGALTGALIFFILTNFGVWSLGSYGYNLNGIVTCYTLALPFFAYSIISTLIFSAIIETILKFKIIKSLKKI